MLTNPPCPKCGLPMTPCEWDYELVKHDRVLSYLCDGNTTREAGCGYVAQPTDPFVFPFPDGCAVSIIMYNTKPRPGRVVGHSLCPKLGWLNHVLHGVDGHIGRFTNHELQPRLELVHG